MIGDKKRNVSILLEFFDLAIMVTLNSSGTSNSKALGADRDATGGRCNSWAWWRLSTTTRRWLNVSGAGLSYSSSQPCAVEEMGNVVDAISFKTPYDEGEDVYNGTENNELDDEDRERIGRIKGFNEALDDLKHHVEKTLVGPKQTTRGGGNQDSFP